jgi:ketosteroid isomerase-like protein
LASAILRAMSRENVELVRRAYQAFNEGGVEAVIGDYWRPEIIWDASPTGIPGLGVYRGYDEVRTFFDDWFGAFPFDEWEAEVEQLIDAGDRVVAMVTQRGRGRASGAAAALEMGQVITLRDGEVVRIDVYLDRAQALEAAGLGESGG